MTPIPNSCFSSIIVQTSIIEVEETDFVNFAMGAEAIPRILSGQWLDLRYRVLNDVDRFSNQSLEVVVTTFVSNQVGTVFYGFEGGYVGLAPCSDKLNKYSFAYQLSKIKE
jgi:hypothetical protein